MAAQGQKYVGDKPICVHVYWVCGADVIQNSETYKCVEKV